MSVRYLALGDSYTIGEGVPEAARWPLRVAAALHDDGLDLAPPQLLAATGWSTDELDAAIDAAAPQGPFDLVSLLVGVNDQYRGRPAAAYRAPYRALLARAVAFAGRRPQRVLAVSIPDWGVTPFARHHERDPAVVGAELDAYNAIAADEAARAGVHWIDVTALSRACGDDRALLAADGLHPGPDQYARWAQQVLPVARRALASA